LWVWWNQSIQPESITTQLTGCSTTELTGGTTLNKADWMNYH
jgi:hypothetical protein